jgi:hypothetical protein
MSFLRHLEIYQSDEHWLELGRQFGPTPHAHRLDEFPAAYSWRVALQQSPLPLRQLGAIVRKRSSQGKNYFRLGATVS